MSSRARRRSGARLALQVAVDGVRQPSFQTAQGFLMALPRRAFALVIGLSGGVAADLGDRHDVQTEVELAVPGPRKSMAHDITRGHLDRGGAGVGGERRRGGEPGDVPDPGQDLPGG